MLANTYSCWSLYNSQPLVSHALPLGYDGSDGSDNSLLMSALCDLVAMQIAATADDIEATTRQLGSEVLPSLVAYFRQAPDSNFWLRKEPN